MGTLSLTKEARIYNEEKAGSSISGSNSKASAYNAGDPGVQSLGLEDLLEKEMAIHCGILAWKILWVEKPDRLQSMESQRVGHN